MEEEEEEAAAAIQASLNLVEAGNAQLKSGMMEMIFVSSRNQDQMPLPEEEGKLKRDLKQECLCRPYT